MHSTNNDTFFNYTADSLPPAQLWIGNHENGIRTVTHCAQKLLCRHNGCGTCITCMQIETKQHHAIMWLYPDKTYTIEQLDPLFSAITFQLDESEIFLFIIQKADLLTNACANKLLKSIEEPPPGYHFILLAEHTHTILPTILSRCTLHSLPTPHTPLSNHPIIENFTMLNVTIAEFAKTVDSFPIPEQECILFLDEILNYWLQQYQQVASTSKINTLRIQMIIKTLNNAYRRLPMPGSSAIFWHNLYLTINHT